MSNNSHCPRLQLSYWWLVARSEVMSADAEEAACTYQRHQPHTVRACRLSGMYLVTPLVSLSLCQSVRDTAISHLPTNQPATMRANVAGKLTDETRRWGDDNGVSSLTFPRCHQRYHSPPPPTPPPPHPFPPICFDIGATPTIPLPLSRFSSS